MSRLARTVLAAAGASAALAALSAWSRREVRRAEAAYPPEGDVLELPSGARLHVVEEGEGTPVVFVHGADGVALSFTETVTAEVAGDHRVLSLDRPGHGWSTLPPGEPARVATNVDVIREGMRSLGVERPIVVGHSYGGLCALAWALDHPGEVRALVLLAPVAGYPWRLPARLLRLAAVPVVGRVLTEALVVPLGRVLIGALERNAFHPQEVPETYAAYSRALYLRPSQFRALAAEYVNLADDVHDLASRFAAVSVPVEIVAAEGDRVTRPRHHAGPLASAVPEAHVVELRGTGHELMWSRPDAIVDAVRRAEERSR